MGVSGGPCMHACAMQCIGRACVPHPTHCHCFVFTEPNLYAPALLHTPTAVYPAYPTHLPCTHGPVPLSAPRPFAPASAPIPPPGKPRWQCG